MKYGCVCVFQFPIDQKIRHKWLEKCYPKDKNDKSARSSIYFSMAEFIDNIKFPLSNLNINNLQLINFHISLKTKRLFRSFDSHSDKTGTLSKLLPSINKFRNKILDFFRKCHEGGFRIVRVIVMHVLNPLFFKEKPSSQLIPVLVLQRIAELSSPSHILYTLVKRYVVNDSGKKIICLWDYFLSVIHNNCYSKHIIVI